jgi:hypothetical protein
MLIGKKGCILRHLLAARKEEIQNMPEIVEIRR